MKNEKIAPAEIIELVFSVINKPGGRGKGGKKGGGKSSGSSSSLLKEVREWLVRLLNADWEKGGWESNGKRENKYKISISLCEK